MSDCPHDYGHPIRETRACKYGAFTVLLCPLCGEDITDKYYDIKNKE
jgi:hypothetical protein